MLTPNNALFPGSSVVAVLGISFSNLKMAFPFSSCAVTNRLADTGSEASNGTGIDMIECYGCRFEESVSIHQQVRECLLASRLIYQMRSAKTTAEVSGFQISGLNSIRHRPDNVNTQGRAIQRSPQRFICELPHIHHRSAT
jgi:hypothetical protein